MTKLIIGDLHIDEQSIPELEVILKEILSNEADEVIQVGDFYNNKRPTPAEIHFGTHFALKLKEKYKKVIILKGNHDLISDKVSAIDYLSLLGITIVEQYIDEWNNFYGHFFTELSKYEYGSHTHTTKDLAKYNYVVLGHQHNPQVINHKISHLGSARYINFNEVEDRFKQLALMKNLKEISFITLESPIKMKDVHSIEELAKVSPDTKVRLVISSFAQFKREVSLLKDYKDKFEEFKTKLTFENINHSEEPNEAKIVKSKPLENIIKEAIAKIEDKDVRKILEEQFKEEK